MKTRADIELYLNNLGIEIKPQMVDRQTTFDGKLPTETVRYNGITGKPYTVSNVVHYQEKELNADATNALKSLIAQSIISDDMETAKTALDVLQAESTFYYNNLNAAISPEVPLGKRVEFDQYCQSLNQSQYSTPDERRDMDAIIGRKYR